MKTITLHKHIWFDLRHPVLQKQADGIPPPAKAATARPRAPATIETKLWGVSTIRIAGVVLPNRYQMILFISLCLILASPVFFLDNSEHALKHGVITLASIAVSIAFLWIVGMLLAETSSNSCEKKKEPGSRPPRISMQ